MASQQNVAHKCCTVVFPYFTNHNIVCFSSRITICFFFTSFSSAHQPTHFLYPTEPAALAYRPVTASQLALASTRYGSNPGGYHLTVSTSSNSPSATGTLQPLTHFSAQNPPFQYIASNPPPQTTGHHTSPPVFQPRPLAYGQVLQPSIQVAVPPATYLTQPRQIQQTVNFGYGQVASTSVPVYSRDRLPNPPEYSQGSYTSSPQHQQQSRQWNSPNFP